MSFPNSLYKSKVVNVSPLELSDSIEFCLLVHSWFCFFFLLCWKFPQIFSHLLLYFLILDCYHRSIIQNICVTLNPRSYYLLTIQGVALQIPLPNLFFTLSWIIPIYIHTYILHNITYIKMLLLAHFKTTLLSPLYLTNAVKVVLFLFVTKFLQRLIFLQVLSHTLQSSFHTPLLHWNVLVIIINSFSNAKANSEFSTLIFFDLPTAFITAGYSCVIDTLAVRSLHSSQFPLTLLVVSSCFLCWWFFSNFIIFDHPSEPLDLLKAIFSVKLVIIMLWWDH